MAVRYAGAGTAPAFAFTGTGLDDATAGGTPIYGGMVFTVEIDGNGTPDTFKWRIGAGSWTTSVPITGAAQALAYGFTVTFAALIGHTVTDSWASTSVGGNINTTIAGDTRLDIVDNLKVQLVNAGWTEASGATGDWYLNSGTTPEGHNMQVRLLDPGSGNCAQIFILNQAGTLAPTQCTYLLAGAAKIYQVLANAYQFFCFVPGSSVARQYMGAGVADVFSFLALDNCSWMGGNTSGDAITVVHSSFNNGPHNGFTGSTHYGGTPAVILHNSQWSAAETSSGLELWHGDGGRHASPLVYRCWDGTTIMEDARLCLAVSSTGEPYMVGQLWDAFWSYDVWNSGAYVTYDGKQFMAVTHQGSVIEQRGTLFIYAP